MIHRTRRKRSSDMRGGSGRLRRTFTSMSRYPFFYAMRYILFAHVGGLRRCESFVGKDKFYDSGIGSVVYDR